MFPWDWNENCSKFIFDSILTSQHKVKDKQTLILWVILLYEKRYSIFKNHVLLIWSKMNYDFFYKQKFVVIDVFCCYDHLPYLKNIWKMFICLLNIMISALSNWYSRNFELNWNNFSGNSGNYFLNGNKPISSLKLNACFPRIA